MGRDSVGTSQVQTLSDSNIEGDTTTFRNGLQYDIVSTVIPGTGREVGPRVVQCGPHNGHGANGSMGGYHVGVSRTRGFVRSWKLV